MRIEIIEERDNPLLNRREIKLRIFFERETPRFLDVRRKLIEKLKLRDELTIVNSIYTEFGRHSASCYLKVYKDKESMRVEPEHRIRKNFPKKEEKEDKGKEGDKNE
ncbi:MAG: 30S ribosomal protein S24e [Candidatus Altiarchaeales archaeon]|nr:MAG: 30S ribosomal protein S24e [Candidatus Altiarchaeales archaeon]RLI94730.1 MAG: 30S ribosomal protein S24e [Candidatus Altiarchaeales archaeon]RLI94838.1 MAG: 30S ribosomal protein S24e [Candidatus Altiarchaeales archaeon]HDO82698.1 30S ribosomal protein S24e [Candidatus Altiarchaeales archaeon]HEX55347.1 30S ribosomal protein S24e [Candidatus Altiarchaeales archaeon]